MEAHRHAQNMCGGQVRGQLVGPGDRTQVWQQVCLPIEPSHWLKLHYFTFNFIILRGPENTVCILFAYYYLSLFAFSVKTFLKTKCLLKSTIMDWISFSLKNSLI